MVRVLDLQSREVMDLTPGGGANLQNISSQT